MRAPSANTRASRNVSSTASQPVSEKRVEMQRMRGRRNRLCNPADDDADDLQREQRPGDGLKSLRVGGDEGTACAHGVDDGEQPVEDGAVHGKRPRPQHGDGAQCRHQSIGIR